MATELELAGQVISAVIADFTVALQATGEYEIRIEGTFGLRDSHGATAELVPGAPGVDEQVGDLAGERITRASIDDSGALSVGFDSGRAIRVMPDDDYEAWTVAGPRGMKVVSTPGGEVATWSAPPS